MAIELESIREIEILERKGKELCLHHSTISPEQYQIDVEAFRRWRVEVSKMLFSTLGSSNHYYQCFWKTVIKPTVADVEEGLRLLAEVRNDLEGIFPMNALYCPVS